MSSLQEQEKKRVGIDLQEGEEAEAVAAAVSETYSNATVRRMPGLIRIEVPGQLSIQREAVQKHLRRDWDTQDLNLFMVTFYGEIEDWDEDHIIIGWHH